MALVVVTGGAGFIGSHIVDKLIADGHETIIYDIDLARSNPDCRTIKGDILDLQRLTQATRDADAVYNIAAEANVNRFLESPLYSNAVTSQGVLNVLEAARINGVKRVLHASTEWVYGSSDGDDSAPITEQTPYTVNPDHLYTSSKIAAELFAKNYQRLYGVSFTIIRYGIPFGERARPETVTPIFIRRILKGEEITIHGDGSQTRQFIYVKDLAAGNVACMQHQGGNEIFNINGARKISVLDIVHTLEGILDKKARYRFITDRPGDFKGRFISSEKAKRMLGWEPRYTYEEAMRHYVGWFLKNEVI